MKRLICAVTIWLICTGTGFGSDALVGLYNRGNELYRAGDFESAVSAYEGVIAQGVIDGQVFYNLGNAYYKNRQLGRAILSFERALKLMPGDVDVLANLAFANAQKTDRESSEDVNLLTRILGAIYDFFGLDALALMVCFFLFGLGGVVVGWIFVPVRRLLWGSLLVVLGCAFLASASLLAFKIHEYQIPRAVVLSEEAVGRSGPGTDFLQVFTLHEGTKVAIERVEGRWLLVRVRAGLGGWLEVSMLERI